MQVAPEPSTVEMLRDLVIYICLWSKTKIIMTDTDHMSFADNAIVYEFESSMMDNFSMDFTNNMSSPEDTWDATIDMWVVL